MNERIKQLAEQAGFMEEWFSESGDDCEREIKKFAELIVQECMELVEGYTKQRAYDTYYRAEEQIRANFGVEL